MADEVHAHTSDDVLAFEFVCPRCAAPMVQVGRVVLTETPDRGSVVCAACGAEYRLALEPSVG